MKAKTASVSPTMIVEGEHLIGKLVGDPRGATLIVVGSVHGNEPGGTIALRNVWEQLNNPKVKVNGRIYFLAGNTRALVRGVRFVGADLNRYWTNENLARNRTASLVPQLAEDFEQRELLQIFDEILQTAEAEVFALDLHSTSAEGLPFATVGDTMRNRRFALRFPVTILLGIEEQLDGTMLEYLNNAGAVTLGFEGGQHDSPETAKNHEALIWLALINSGILDADAVPDPAGQHEKLLKASGTARILEVRHREVIKPGDEFEMQPGFENFDLIERGQLLAKNKNGEIRAGEPGLMMMPLYQKQGEDGFFIGREIAPFWLWLSGVVRKLKIAALVRILPGVWRSSDEPDSLIVNTRVARFFPLQIFHLLGFRKRRWRGNHLVVSRRRHDTISPFKRGGKKSYG